MFIDAHEFPFTATLEVHWQVIRDEFQRLEPRHLMSWPERDLYNQGWKVFGLWAFGKRIDQNCELCPETARLLNGVPGLTTAGFSQLAPGTDIRPHEGYTGSVLRCHLGLVIPADCCLKVGEEVRSWQPGRCLVFDDTTMHSAWNHSGQPRIILLVDFVRPGQTFDPAVTGEAAAAVEQILQAPKPGRQI